MPMYSSRFANNMTRHSRNEVTVVLHPAGLGQSGSRSQWAYEAYEGPERQCQATTGWAVGQATYVRCPHAARYRDGQTVLCGNCSQREHNLIVSGA